jgi:hypothetical protein
MAFGGATTGPDHGEWALPRLVKSLHDSWPLARDLFSRICQSAKWSAMLPLDPIANGYNRDMPVSRKTIVEDAALAGAILIVVVLLIGMLLGVPLQ